jgi:hypothetical protein
MYSTVSRVSVQNYKCWIFVCDYSYFKHLHYPLHVLMVLYYRRRFLGYFSIFLSWNVLYSLLFNFECFFYNVNQLEGDGCWLYSSMHKKNLHLNNIKIFCNIGLLLTIKHWHIKISAKVLSCLAQCHFYYCVCFIQKLSFSKLSINFHGTF